MCFVCIGFVRIYPHLVSIWCNDSKYQAMSTQLCCTQQVATQTTITTTLIIVIVIIYTYFPSAFELRASSQKRRKTKINKMTTYSNGKYELSTRNTQKLWRLLLLLLWLWLIFVVNVSSHGSNIKQNVLYSSSKMPIDFNIMHIQYTDIDAEYRHQYILFLSARFRKLLTKRDSTFYMRQFYNNKATGMNGFFLQISWHFRASTIPNSE